MISSYLALISHFLTNDVAPFSCNCFLRVFGFGGQLISAVGCKDSLISFFPFFVTWKWFNLRMQLGSLLSASYSHLAPSLDPWQVLTFEALKVSEKTRPSLQLWVIRLLKQIKFHFFLALRLMIFNIIVLSGTSRQQTTCEFCRTVVFVR